MVKFAVSNNQRDGYEGYKQGTPFDDNKKRNKRVQDRKIQKRRNHYFAKQRRAEAAREAAVITALKNKDEAALQAIAMSVALSVLSV